jgi:FKBP-type peptidyl-prolyl cis-trans isomerase FkpA
MKVGGKAKLVCPSGIAYGDRGAPPKIKGGAALVFEVELIDIEAPAAAAPAGHGGGDKPSDKPSGHP